MTVVARRTPAWTLLGVAVVIAALLALAGQMRPWITPDTAGWLDACVPSGCWAGPRTPIYGWLARAVSFGGTALWLLPWLQGGSLVAAALWLMRGMLRLGASAMASLAVGLALLGSNMVVLWARALLPEMFAHAAMLAATGCTLHLAAEPRGRARIRLLAAAGALSGAAYLLKPALLLLPLLLPILLLALAPRRRTAAALLAAVMLPFLLAGGCRWATLGDFNIVSFGGFQMSGMAALMLTPDLVQRLPPDLQVAAADIVSRRDALVAAHLALPIPLNSHGERSFVSAAAGYFDVLARTHDDVMFGAVAPGRLTGETWVTFNARMQHLALATIAAAPRDYAAWIVGGLTRLVGHMLVLNFSFVLGCLVWFGLFWRAAAPARPQDARLLGLLTATWTVGAGLPAVLLTFPAARYADSAGLLLAAWPIHAVLRHLGPAAAPPAQAGITARD